MEKGKTYEINHKSMGKFTMIIRLANKSFTSGTVVEEKPGVIDKENRICNGNRITVSNCLCEFKEVETVKEPK